jgi:hypothetical protein
MSGNKAPRGRPKGSGLDDRARLLAVAQIIAGNPEMKPTTAIKSTGVSDPSTIRRLRDKFHGMRAELAAELERPGKPSPAAPIVPGESKTGPRALAAVRANAPRKRSSVTVAPPTEGPGLAASGSLAADVASVAAVEPALEALSADEARTMAHVETRAAEVPLTVVPALQGLALGPAPQAPSLESWMSLWFGLGLQSFTTAASFQISLFERMMHWPHFASALRGQVALNQMTLALCTASQRLRTVH